LNNKRIGEDFYKRQQQEEKYRIYFYGGIGGMHGFTGLCSKNGFGK